MSKPSLNIAFSTNNLLKDIQNIDGKAALIGAGDVGANCNKVIKGSSLAEFEQKGITLAAEPRAYRHIKEFYGELGGNQELFIYLCHNLELPEMIGIGDGETGVNALIKAGGGQIAYLGAFVGIKSSDPGEEFFDRKVEEAITASQSLIEAWNQKLYFFRILLEGYQAGTLNDNISNLKANNNGFVGVVVGGTQANESASVGLVLGRKVKYACHIKLGKVANGPLRVNELYINTQKISELNLDPLHDAGAITFLTYPGKPGYYIGIDNMCTDDDTRILAHGAVLDATAKVVAAVYLDELESEVDTNPNGTIKEVNALFLENKLKQQAIATLGERISDIEVLVDRTVNIINTGRTKIKVRVRPKGYNTFIDVDLGLTAGA